MMADSDGNTNSNQQSFQSVNNSESMSPAGLRPSGARFQMLNHSEGAEAGSNMFDINLNTTGGESGTIGVEFE